MILYSSKEYLDTKMSVLDLLCNIDRSQLISHVSELMDRSKGLESEQLREIMLEEGFLDEELLAIPCAFL